MAKIRFSAAASLDGFIAGPNGESDWIVPDPDMDFVAYAAQFDILLVGRRTFDIMATAKRTTMPGLRTVVVSTTLSQQEHPDVTIIGAQVEQSIRALRDSARKDIWLFGGADLFARLLAVGLVDTVELAIQPVLLGRGVPLLPEPSRRRLQLTDHTVSRAGAVRLTYDVLN